MGVPPEPAGGGSGQEPRTYPAPGQPIPPPAPGPRSPLSAIAARAVLLPLMGATVVWALVLAVGVVLGGHLLPATGPAQGVHWHPPLVALVGCGLGLAVWVVGLATCWRRPVLWVWAGVGAVLVAAGTLAYLVMVLG